MTDLSFEYTVRHLNYVAGQIDKMSCPERSAIESPCVRRNPDKCRTKGENGCFPRHVSCSTHRLAEELRRVVSNLQRKNRTALKLDLTKKDIVKGTPS